MPYLFLAAVSSVLLAVGLLMMKSRADVLPAAYGENLPRAVLQWLRDPMWTGGLVVQAAGYALYVFSLTNAQISMVAVMQQGGIALFVVLSITLLGERARPSEWAGIFAIILGMLMLTLSLSADDSEGVMDPRALLALSALLTVAGLAPYAIERLRSNGIAAAILSGMVFGLAGLFAKGMTDDLAARESVPFTLRVVSDPCIYGVIVCNIAGLVLLQNSFNAGRGIIVMPLSSALSNIVAIVGGMAAFAEHLPGDRTSAAMRIIAFLLTVAGSALLTDSRAPAVQPVAQRFESTT